MVSRESSDMVKTFVEGYHDVADIKQMKFTTLGRTELEVSFLGFGASSLTKYDSAEGEKSAAFLIETAVKLGINYIDTAPWYGFGIAEKVLGKALKNVPRNAYHIATKVGRYESDHKKMFDFSAQKTLQSIDTSLQKLGCGQIDVIQVHDVEFAPNLEIILNETLPALQKAKEAGKVRYIGITGYMLEPLKNIVEKSIIPIDTVLSYCRCCFHDTSLLDNVHFFKDRGLGVIDAAGLGMGLYTDAPLPVWHPAPSEIRDACRNAGKYCADRNVDFSKLALSFNLQQKGADTHLIGCPEVDFVQRNVDLYRNGLDEKEKTVLNDLISKYFDPLKIRNWDGIELAKYWKKCKSAAGTAESAV